MNVEHLQVENGHFTRIVNPLIEELIKIPFKGCELAIAMHIIRKTYGYQKKEDEISISQFEEAVNRGRPTVVKALKNLQLVNVVKLGKVGNMKGQSSVWSINKYPSTWKLVKTGSLVKGKSEPSKYGYTKPSKDGLTHKRKKEIIQKKEGDAIASGYVTSFNPLGAEIIKAFEAVDPKNKTYYGNKTQRSACDFLLQEYGLEDVLKRISVLSKTNKLPYFPPINSPNDLKEKWVRLQDAVEKKRAEKITKTTPNYII